MAWCRQATSHYLSQCWPRSLSPYDVTRPQWVKTRHGWLIGEKDFHTSSISLLMMVKELRQNNSCSSLAYFFCMFAGFFCAEPSMCCLDMASLVTNIGSSGEWRWLGAEIVLFWALSINIIPIALLLWECRHDFKVMLDLAHVFSNSWLYSVMRDGFFFQCHPNQFCQCLWISFLV